jgi:hypothetical protein
MNIKYESFKDVLEKIIANRGKTCPTLEFFLKR